MFDCTYSPSSKSHMCTDLCQTPTSGKQFLRAIWEAVSWTIVLIITPLQQNLTHSSQFGYLFSVHTLLHSHYIPIYDLLVIMEAFYCSGFCHTLKWNRHGFTCVPHPDHPSHLPLHPIPLGLPSAPGPSACLMHPTWAGDLFHLDNIHVSMLFSWNIPPSPSPTESKRLFYTSVSLFLFCI